MTELLTANEVAAMLKICTKTVCGLFRTNKIRGTRVAGKWRTTQSALEEFLREKR